MIISFFNGGGYATGIDYSAHPDLMYQGEIPDDFDFSAFEPKLVENNGKYEIIFEKLPPPPETEEEKFARIFTYLANPENHLDKEKLEGINFNDEQIGDLILHRVFGGNPHAQTALQTKIIGMLISGKQNTELIKEITEKQVKLNEVRVFFNLEPITF